MGAKVGSFFPHTLFYFSRLKIYLLHTRPLMIPVIALNYSLGYALAGGLKSGENLSQFLIGMLVWAVLGNGANLCINSYYDRDIGDIAFLNNPPPAPKYLHFFGIGVGVLGLLLTVYLLPVSFLGAYLLAGILAILYSHPRLRLKNTVGLAALTNGIGYSILTPYAGWSIVNMHLQPAFVWISLGMFSLSLTGYWASQLYQVEDDRIRGDTTMAGLLGARKTLNLALFSGVIGYGLIVHTIFIRVMPVLTALVGIPIIAGISSFAYWYTHASDKRTAKIIMYIGFAIVGVTNICIMIGTLGQSYYNGWLFTDLFR